LAAANLSFLSFQPTLFGFFASFDLTPFFSARAVSGRFYGFPPARPRPTFLPTPFFPLTTFFRVLRTDALFFNPFQLVSRFLSIFSSPCWSRESFVG